MSRHARSPDELTFLMELRLAFGPGTRLWADRSREELCYDWLRYKGSTARADYRQFAQLLYASEVLYSSGRGDLAALRRRLVSVLRSHGIRKRLPQVRTAQAAPKPHIAGTAGMYGCNANERVSMAGTELPIPASSFEARTPGV